jgi:hypothetical protein
VAAALYAAVFGLRFTVEGTDEAVSILYVLPITLLAFAFGRRGGLVAGCVGLSLFTVWAIGDDVSLSLFGWLSRVVPMLLLGVLVGGAADRQREFADMQRQLLTARLRARDAAEINDSIVQGLAVAKWSLEAGAYDRGLDVLTDTIQTAEDLVADLLGDRPVRAAVLRRQPPAAPETTDLTSNVRDVTNE